MAQKDILRMNAALKYIEFVIGIIDKADDTKTVGQLRGAFKEEFKQDLPPLIDQHFGIIRLIPLMHMVEDGYLENTEDGKTIRAIRNAFAHDTFSCDEDGYTFLPNRPNGKLVKISYEDFVLFLWRIENEFYKNLRPGT
ncbi:MAG: hypothetical protein WAK07_17910 [Rhodomicrobium sp.]